MRVGKTGGELKAFQNPTLVIDRANEYCQE
jgi:hypothetical protein